MLKVTFTGLEELRNAMRKAAAGTQKNLQRHFKDVATQVASAIAGRVPVLTGKAAASVRPRATTTSASIVAGGVKAPYFPWLEWGGAVGRNKSIQRPFIKVGRTIYPTILDADAFIVQAASEGIGDALVEAGWTPD